MNILAACGGPDSPVRKVVFKSSRPLLRLRARRPELLHRGDAAPAPAAHAAGVGHRRGRRRRRRTSPRATPRSPSRRCASATGSGPDLRTSHSALLGAARGARHPRLRPALPVHPRGRHRRRAAPRGASHELPGHPQRRAGRRARAVGGREPARQAVRAAAAAVGDVAGHAARTACSACSIPDEVRRQLRYGRGLDNRKLKQAGYRFSSRRAKRCRRSPRRCACSRCARAARRHIATSAKSRSSCAGRRASAETSQPADAPEDLQSLAASAAQLPTIRAPDAYPSHRSRRLRGAPRARRSSPASTPTTTPRRTDRRGREGQRRPDRRA